MPRRPRADAPGALSHVILRGVERRRIFHDDEDRDRFLDRLELLLLESDTRCYAWALMDNHAHLVLRTGRVSLSRIMHRLGTSYAIRFNRRHDRPGHLFQDRFKSILVTEESYLLALVRYVHRNPLEAGMFESLSGLEKYAWTAHPVLLGLRPIRFEAADEVLSHFASDRTVARSRLRAWMMKRSEPEPDREPAGRGASEPPRAPLGVSTPQEPAAGLETERVVAVVCRALKVPVQGVLGGRRDRASSLARAVVSYVATCHVGIPGVRVARSLGVSEAAVSKASERGRCLPGSGEIVAALQIDGRKSRASQGS